MRKFHIAGGASKTESHTGATGQNTERTSGNVL